MAPEQVHGREDLDVRADLYALGATLYHLATGRPPFPGPETRDVLRAHLDDELTPPDHLNTDLSAGFGEVVEILMAKDREQRYRTPDDLILDLECLLAGEAPRLARQRIAAETLIDLADGEATGGVEAPAGRLPLALWLVLGGLLGLSLLLNLILLSR
jgi:serine/threonine-protein kinase